MRIAITGVRGRLGRVLREHFASAGDEVSSYSRNADAAHDSLSSLPERLESGAVDVLLHLAWSTVPATAEHDPGVEWRHDLPLLASLLSSLRARAQAGRCPRLIFFSTCAVYGEPQPGQIFTERDEPRPKGWYASGKVAAERLVERFRLEHGLPTCALRVTNPYCFTQGDQCMQGVIPAMLSAAAKGTEFTVWGEGDAVKDYLHVHDLCAAVDAVVRSSLTGTYNVASGVSRSLREVADLVEKSAGAPLRIRHTDARPWDVQHGRYSHNALTEATGWRPKVEFEEGVGRFAGSERAEV
jgi:UDP-glucose 4-epimerase